MARTLKFGALLKAGISSIANCELKTTAVIDAELRQQIGVSGGTIQRYKAGDIPPDLRVIAILAEACVVRGYLARPWLERFLHEERPPHARQAA